MFERAYTGAGDGRTDEILHKIQELCELDPEYVADSYLCKSS